MLQHKMKLFRTGSGAGGDITKGCFVLDRKSLVSQWDVMLSFCDAADGFH